MKLLSIKQLLCIAVVRGRLRQLAVVALAGCILIVPPVPGGETTSSVEQLASDYFSRRLLRAPIESADSEEFRARFLDQLEARLGPVVGYKAGLTSSAAQRRFHADAPVSGVLFEAMLLPTPGELAYDFGARALLEVDLMVRIGDEGINYARSDTDLLSCLDRVAAFIELPDLLFAPGVEIDARQVKLVNLGARFGVVGTSVALHALDNAYERLASFRVELEGSGGVSAYTGHGANLMGHPLNVVRWLRDTLVERGIVLRRGDWLSLGSLTPLQPVRPGSSACARYFGLDPREPLEACVKIK